MYDLTINNLKGILDDSNCINMNRSTIKGYIGELLVKKKLEGEGIGTVEHLGNQSRYDLRLPDMNVKIDVKLSLYKSEISKYPEFKYWGWALQFERNKDKIPACTHYVCVALDTAYEVESYYVIKAENLDKFKKTEIRQFKNVIHGFLITTPTMQDNVPEELRKYFTYCHSLIDL